MATIAGRIFTSCRSTLSQMTVQTRNYAARRGTRDKREKLKKKIKARKLAELRENPPPPRFIASAAKLMFDKIDDSKKPEALDDCYDIEKYKIRRHTLAEAVQNFKEIFHPTMYDSPNAFLNAVFELDMKTEKKTKFIQPYSKIAIIENLFDHGEDRIVYAFTTLPALVEEATKAGATFVGGPQDIKTILGGEKNINDVQHFIASPDIIPELMSLKGLLKTKYPSQRDGTLTTEFAAVIKKFKHGIVYKVHGSLKDPSVGMTDICFGRVNMDIDKLEDNFKAVLNEVSDVSRVKRPWPFVTNVFLTTSTLTPINERFLIDHSIYAAVKLPEKKFDRAKGKKGGKKQEIIEEDEESDEEDDKNYIDEATIATPQ